MTEDLVEAGLAALREEMLGECLHALPNGSCDLSACQCRAEVRAVLAAVEPKIRADERERAAKIADEYSTLWGKAKNDIGLGSAQGGRDIAAAIRADNYGRNPPR